MEREIDFHLPTTTGPSGTLSKGRVEEALTEELPINMIVVKDTLSRAGVTTIYTEPDTGGVILVEVEVGEGVDFLTFKSLPITHLRIIMCPRNENDDDIMHESENKEVY